MKLLNQPTSNFYLELVSIYILCTLNADGLRSYPNKSTINNQLELIVERVSHNIFSGGVVIDVVKD